MSNLENIPTPLTQMNERLAKLEKSNGGGHNTPMDDDTRLNRIEDDLRKLLVALCVAFVLLASAIGISHMALSNQISGNSAYTAEHIGEIKGMLSVLIDNMRG